jgi:hypothetical protein
VVRDVRAVWNSLASKHYGRNATSSRHPPLRTRFRRFLADWEHFRVRDLPILKYEALVTSPESSLKEACGRLELAWSDDMLTWPKQPESILDAFWGNATFHRNRRSSLSASLSPAPIHQRPSQVLPGDLHWLQETFHDFNVAHGYPLTHDPEPVSPDTDRQWAIPALDVTPRRRLMRPLAWIHKRLTGNVRLRRWAIRIQSRQGFPRRGARRL